MTCHHGSTPQHGFFVFLYLAALCWLVTRRHTPLAIVGVASACSVLAAVYHVGMARTCESASVSAAVHAHWDADVFFRLHMAFVLLLVCRWLGRRGGASTKAPADTGQ